MHSAQIYGNCIIKDVPIIKTAMQTPIAKYTTFVIQTDEVAAAQGIENKFPDKTNMVTRMIKLRLNLAKRIPPEILMTILKNKHKH